MKITCQSCQSKYNVADEKVQGKIVKIRCRKCGATIVVNGSTASAANGNGAAAAEATAVPTAPKSEPSDTSTWHVNVAEDDQRTATLAELLDLCRAGTIGQETYVWREGMGDWQPIAEIEAITILLDGPPPSSRRADVIQVPSVRPKEDVEEPTRAFQAPTSTAYEAPATSPVPASVAVAEVAAEPKRAVKREPVATPTPPIAADSRPQAFPLAADSRPQGSPFAADSRPQAFPLAADSRPQGSPFAADSRPQVSPLLNVPPSSPFLGDMNDDAANRRPGERNENSVLFSLAVLTKTADDRAPSTPGNSNATTDDSGLIDLKALAAKTESMRPAIMADNSVFSPPLGPMTSLASPLGGVSGIGEGGPKSRLPLLIGGGAGALLILVLGIVIGVKVLGGTTPPPPAPIAASAAALPAPAPSPEPTPSAAPTQTAPSPEASGAAMAAATTSATPKPHALPGGGGAAWHPQSSATSKPPVATAAPAAAPAPAPKKGDCGCNGDLMCLMKCSTH